MTVTAGASPIGAQDTVQLANGPGVAFVPADAPLIGLNYFDGRFLRADDLNLERRGQRTYANLSNQARGYGVVSGFDLTAPDGATLALSAGLAVDPQGRVLHLPVAVTATVRAILQASGTAASGTAASGTPAAPEPAAAGFAPCTTAAAAPPATAAVAGSGFFLVCLAAATGLCGQAEVLGRLCDDGCITAADRPYVVDGVRVLLQPLTLDLGDWFVANVTTGDHLRAQAAAAYFAKERADAGSRLSAAGLGGAVWSAGATAPGGDVVPVGLLGWNGTTITVLDEWTARRELIDPTPARYWAGRVEQRPWSVFLAQVLQFQAQLTAPAPTVPTPAVPARILLERGLVELPPAGYLAVDQSRPDDLRGQLQDLMGPGVALRLCAVPRDQVPRELERGQHLDRISLLRAAQGRPPEPVDVFVPDGTLVTVPAARGVGFAVEGRAGAAPLTAEGTPLSLLGAARRGPDKPVDVRLAITGAASQGLGTLVAALTNQFTASTPDPDDLARRRPQPVDPDVVLLRRLGDAAFAASVRRRAGAPAAAAVAQGQGAAAWVSATIDDDPFTLTQGTSTRVELMLDLSVTGDRGPDFAAQIRGGVLERRPQGTRDPAREAVVRLVGVLEVVVTNPTGMQVPGSPRQAVDVTLVLHRGTQDGRPWFAVTDENTRLAAAVLWDTPDSARAALATRRGEDAADLAPLVAALAAPDLFDALGKLTGWQVPLALTARADAGVAQSTEQHHEAAVAALLMLAPTHPDDLGYAADRSRQLFPPDDAAVTAAVRPSTDWVLFRRRTSRECEDAPVRPPQAAPVTVWIRTEDGTDAAVRVAREVASGRWPDDQGWRRADVAFDPVQDTLLTAPGTWRASYQFAQGGPHILLAAYAGTPSDPAALHVPRRLDVLLAATPPVATPDADVAIGVAVDPPGGLILPATVGSIFLVTYTVPDTPAPQLAVAGTFSTDELARAVDNGDAAALGRLEAGLDRFADLPEQAGDLGPLVRALETKFPAIKPGSVRAVLWVDPALPAADRTALADLAKRAASAAEPVLTAPGTALTVGPPIGVAPPADLPRAVLFLLFTVALL